MRCIHFLQHWFGLSNPVMEEALYDVPLYRQFASLDIGVDRLPNKSTTLRFRHLLEEHELGLRIFEPVDALLTRQGLMLRASTTVDATIIAAPSATKNGTGTRDSEIVGSLFSTIRKGNRWHFGLKAHISVDTESGLVHTMVTTPTNAYDVTQVRELLHSEGVDVFADSGYRGAHKRQEAKDKHLRPHWHIAMMPGKREAPDQTRAYGRLIDELEHTKIHFRANVEHLFRVLKCQFGFTEVRYRGQAKKTTNLAILFTLTSLWMAHKRILRAAEG